MHKKIILCTLLLCLSAMAFAQNKKEPKTVAEVLDHSLTSLEKEFVPAAEAMPADKYDYAPTAGEFKGVRTFGLQVRHVAAVNYALGAALLGEKPPVDLGKDENGADSLTSKEAIVKYAQDSFAYLHKALLTVNDKNIVAPIKSPWGEGNVTRLYLVNLALSHPFDHYGQMVEYLRLNSIIPPASR
ncbi:MAG: DinB family protein [Acidobacteria bacterium]|nr:DinB family protein [Acidobacteriota bacterium]